jgi:PIN domain nuclease of toxin-antitoxin system
LRVLLDTHAFLWWIEGNRRLSRAAKSLIEDPKNELLVSAATIWEIATKVRLGRLSVAAGSAPAIADEIAAQGFTPLGITVAHAELAGGLPGAHGDPFDRMLLAQAILEGVPIVSIDNAFDGHGVSRVW